MTRRAPPPESSQAEPKRMGRPPVADPWVNLSVRLRRSDLDAYRVKLGMGSPSVALREVVLEAIRDR